MFWDDSSAAQARDYMATLDGQRVFRRAALDSDEALEKFFEPFGATSVTRTREPTCHTCHQHWAQGAVQYTVAFDDNYFLQFEVDPR